MRLETQLGGILLTNLAGEHCEFCSLNKFLSLQRENSGIFGNLLRLLQFLGRVAIDRGSLCFTS